MFIRMSRLLFVALLAGACSLPVETFRATAYSEIAKVQMAAGDPAGARDTAQRAVAVIAGTGTEDERVFGIPTAAIAQMRAGDLDGAAKMIETAEKDQSRVLAYAAYAMALMESGHHALARQAAARALEIATDSESEYDRDEMMVYAAWAQAVTGDVRDAFRNVEAINREKHRDGLLALIAEAQLEAGDIAGALATAESIGPAAEHSDNDAWIFGRLVRGIAGDPIAVFNDLLFESRMPLQAIALTKIGVAQARAGYGGNARRSFIAAMQFAETERSVEDRVQSMGTIALGQARSGDLSGALASLDHAGRQVDEAAAEEAGAAGEARIYLQVIRSAIGGGTIIAEMVERPARTGNQGETFVIGAMAHIQLGNPHQAEDYLAAAVGDISGDDDLSLLAAAYSSLAGLRITRGDRAGGRAAATQSLAVTERIADGTEDRIIGLFFASVALARTGDVERALETAGRMQKPASK